MTESTSSLSNNLPESICAVILAAGSSRRMGEVDKILVPLAGKPLIAWSVEAFERSRSVSEIVIVTSSANLEALKRVAAEFGWRKLTCICLGGERRQDSVWNGIKAIQGAQYVAIHDGARPFITEEIIEVGFMEAKTHGAAVAAVPVKDTIKVVGENQRIQYTPDRRNLWAAQTPQVFRLDLIREAYLSEQGDVTDDSSLLENQDVPVKVFAGSYYNIKITTPEDLVLAEAIARSLLKA